MTTYYATVIKISIHTKDESPIFGENATHVSVEDDGGGAYLQIAQCNDSTEDGVVTFNDLAHFDAVYQAVREMLPKLKETKNDKT